MAKQAKNNDVKDSATKRPIDENSDDLKFTVISDKEKRTKWDFKNLNFVHSTVAEHIMEQADAMMHHLLKELGEDLSKPRVPGVFKMYRQVMNTPEANSYIPLIEKIEQHAPGSISDLLKAKFTFEQSSHKEQSDFLLNCIKGGAGIEAAKVNWDYAVHTYKEVRENAEANLKETVYSARVSGVNSWENTQSSLTNEIKAHNGHFDYAVKVAQATDDFGRDMTKANATLITAFSKFVSDLVKFWNITAQGESQLILANRKDSQKLWKAIQTSYDKKMGLGLN
ncbi:hypothetical protein [Kriegella aquimaris]|uniref:Uncharacterized protein n=1 Tax=Kriegella aquimaris TaxID=192904 RepID=A0A1G9YUN3_9FLAO|nr:hypothetical protein [Kriegella aquimaris]SDN12103.1 hypothetical protein SAMN04488514_12621 [Kriegella aquimaris]